LVLGAGRSDGARALALALRALLIRKPPVASAQADMLAAVPLFLVISVKAAVRSILLGAAEVTGLSAGVGALASSHAEVGLSRIRRVKRVRRVMRIMRVRRVRRISRVIKVIRVMRVMKVIRVIGLSGLSGLVGSVGLLPASPAHTCIGNHHPGGQSTGWRAFGR
jgi:hypothetical protein